MRTNVMEKQPKAFTHEGGVADPRQTPFRELQRAVATCMLFENTFYEAGSDLADRIAALAAQVTEQELGLLAVSARTDLKLRHVPLFLVAQLFKRKNRTPGYAYRVMAEVIRRPDEMGELIALVTRGRKGTKKLNRLPNTLVRGLARVFPKFSAYQLVKWNRDAAIKLRDVLFLTHPKPLNEEQATTWKQLVDGTLPTPDTWEVGLSAAKTADEKRAVWTHLLAEKKLGYMALLMNLRNMLAVQVPTPMIEGALLAGAKGSWALPFRFVSAAKAAPVLAGTLSDAMLAAVADQPKLPGRTLVLVDVSGSMDGNLAHRSTVNRAEAAAALAIYLREVCEQAEVWTFSMALKQVPSYRGLPLADAILKSQPHSGTYLGQALQTLAKNGIVRDRIIVVTDEQAQDGLVPAFTRQGYIVNVAPYAPGLDVDRNGWVRVNGWSERIVDWIRYNEGLDAAQEETEE